MNYGNNVRLDRLGFTPVGRVIAGMSRVDSLYSAYGEGPPPVLNFADRDTAHPLGRLLIFEGGKFASSYRVKDDQLLVVNRHLGKLNMTIMVLDNKRTAEGKLKIANLNGKPAPQPKSHSKVARHAQSN